MLTSKHKEDIKRITERILETFGKEYLRAFKYVAIRDAKKARKKPKEEDSSIEVEGKVQPESTPENPLRPRGNKVKKEVTADLKIKITGWTTFDEDIDPYVAYIVEASMGDQSSSVYRRFNQFKALHKSMKKAMDLKKKFPTVAFADKKYGGSKLEYNYLHQRKIKLQEYVKLIEENKEVHNNKALIKWLGLDPPEDPKFAEIFDIAYKNTKWRLWIWKRIPYDDEEDAIAKLAIEEIKREVIYDIVSGYPSQIRSTAAASLYKVVCQLVGPPVAAGWKLAREAVQPLKPKISEIVDNAIDKYLDVEEMVKGKLIEGINTGLSPIVEAAEPLIKEMGEKFMDTGFALVKEVYPYSQDLWKLFDDIVESGDEKLCDEVEKLVTAKRTEAEEKVNGILAKALEAIIGDLSSKVTIEALGSIFSPLKKLVGLINSTFDCFLNPTPHVYCMKILCEYRAKLEALSPNDEDFRDKVEKILDEEESWLIWRRYWTYWDYRWKAWSIYYYSYSLPELSVLSKILRKNAFKFAFFHKKWIKKWSWRFGDHLHEKAKVATADSWKEDIRVCFATGYKEANEFFKGKVSAILHQMVIDFFYSAIGVKVEEAIMKLLEAVLDPIQKEIPDPINEILDLETISRECINTALKQNITRIVDNAIVDPYVAAWEQVTF